MNLKMKNYKKGSVNILTIILIIAILGGAVFAYEHLSFPKDDNSLNQQEIPPQNNLEPSIKVYAPLNGEEVENPLIIEGEARGPWFFEATFPIKIYDENNNIIGTGIAQAKDDWMQTDFVPFEAEIIFNHSGGGDGIIVLEKANPSGLAENSEELRINVKFKN